jgi:sulfur-oxidizing protein SoxY
VNASALPHAPRRRLLAATSALLSVSAWPLAAQEDGENPLGILKVPAIASFLNGRTPRLGRVSLDVPRLAENGNSLPMAVSVESPQSAAEHVKILHVYSERNPRRMIARFEFGPDAPRAAVESRIRLANSQRVAAFAEMNDGTLWWAGVHVVVVISSCIDGS